MHIDEILIVKHNNVSYGILTSSIEKIQAIPELTPLVLSPKEIVGLSAVGGNIRTVMDVNLLLGLSAVDTEASLSRLLTLTEPYMHVALLISEVVESILIDEENLETIAQAEDAVVALYKYNNIIIQILDLEALFKGVLLKEPKRQEVKENTQSITNSFEKSESSSERYLLFKMENERYALEIDFLREIIGMPESFTHIAGSSSEIEGMIQLRDEFLVIADLRRFYGFKALKHENNRIIVAQYNGKHIGLIIDEIIDIRDFSPSNIKDLPENFKDKKLSGIIHSDEQLISLIGKNILEEILHVNEKLIISNESNEPNNDSEFAFEVVLFKLGNKEYAINIEDVSEIIDTIAITKVPDAPELIDGIINIRGQVVTIGSLYRRLEVSSTQEDKHKIIVCQHGKDRMGFTVDTISDIIGIHHDEIKPENEHGELFSDVLYLDEGERLALLLNLKKLFDDQRQTA